MNHHSREILDNFNDDSSRFRVENGNLQVINGNSGNGGKEQEFIDHSLLTPEYINSHLTNSFITDLEHSLEHDTGSGHHSSSSYFSPDIHFQNSTLQNINLKNFQDPTNSLEDTKFSLDQNFISIADNLDRHFNDQQEAGQSHHYPSSSLPTLTPIKFLQSGGVRLKPESHNMQFQIFASPQPPEESNEPIDYIRSNSGKILPHKKRITKKLRNSDQSGEFSFLNDSHDGPEDISLDNVVHPNFSCQLCGQGFETQFIFFNHLKSHYETPTLQNSTSISSQEAIVDQKEGPKSPVVDMSLSVTYQREQSPLPIDSPEITSAEIEFSDTEDMLEGIRGVVDKVQENTCDGLDMTKPPESESWMEGNSLNSVNFNESTEAVENDKNLDNEAWLDSSSITSVHSDVEVDDGENLENLDDILVLHEPIRTSPEPLNKFSNSKKNLKQLSVKGDINDILVTKAPIQNSQELLVKNPMGSINLDKTFKKKGRPKGSTKEAKNLKKPNKSKTNTDGDDEGNDNLEEPFEMNMKKQYVCIICNKVANSVNALKYHHLSHTGERSFKCNTCDKAFFALNALKAHERLHSGEKPYECEVCKRCFRQWGDLKYHRISVHTDVKGYQCEFCGKSFARKYSLVIHRRIHTNEKNFICDVCNKAFRANIYLQEHYKIHTGEKPFECDVCQKRFRVRGDLTRHKRTHDKPKKGKIKEIRLKEIKTKDLISQHLVSDSLESDSKKNITFLNPTTDPITQTDEKNIQIVLERDPVNMPVTSSEVSTAVISPKEFPLHLEAGPVTISLTSEGNAGTVKMFPPGGNKKTIFRKGNTEYIVIGTTQYEINTSPEVYIEK